MLDIGFLKAKPNRTDLKIQKLKTRLRFGFQKTPTSAGGDGFSRCLIHSSFCSMIGSTVKVFFFMLYLCTSSSESLRLTVSWTSSARKYLSSVIHIKQHTVQKLNQKKTETMVNFVKPKLNRKPQFFAIPNGSHFLLTAHP